MPPASLPRAMARFHKLPRAPLNTSVAPALPATATPPVPFAGSFLYEKRLLRLGSSVRRRFRAEHRHEPGRPRHGSPRIHWRR
ncbi:hypothetical protein [Lysobacter gummosus]|uniref:hypothetical protein n=1 Tax=Lysobacter gummosus TaxID=262324 RepID=UPI003631B3F4